MSIHEQPLFVSLSTVPPVPPVRAPNSIMASSEAKGFLSTFGGPKGLFGGFVDEENGIFGYTPGFYALWIPAAFLALATALSPKGVAKKFYFWARGFTFFWLYNEKKGMSKVRHWHSTQLFASSWHAH